MYVAMVSEGCSQMVLDGFRRAHNLPMSETAPARIVMRPVAVSTPKRRPSTRKTRKKITKASAATSKSRVSKVRTFDEATRFDLDF